MNKCKQLVLKEDAIFEKYFDLVDSEAMLFKAQPIREGLISAYKNYSFQYPGKLRELFLSNMKKKIQFTENVKSTIIELRKSSTMFDVAMGKQMSPQDIADNEQYIRWLDNDIKLYKSVQAYQYAMAIVIGASAIIMLTLAIVRYHMNKEARKACKGLKGIDKKKCMLKFKIGAQEKALKELISAKSKLSGFSPKKRERYTRRADKAIEKLKNKITKNKIKLSTMK